MTFFFFQKWQYAPTTTTDTREITLVLVLELQYEYMLGEKYITESNEGESQEESGGK